jgi:transcriptional regulator with XRE-family HTH domain
MNIEIANRLVELRKKSGLSQEELAAKLGLSRQAVSKWERAEASPDTDNLICLAKLYGVSLDTLLNTDESIDEIVKEQVKSEESPKSEKGPEAGTASSNEDKSSKNAQTETPHPEQTGSEGVKDGDEVHVDETGIHFKSGNDTGSIDRNGVHIESKDGGSVHIDMSGIHVKDSSGQIHEGTGKFKIKVVSSDEKRERRYHTIQALASSVTVFVSVITYLLLGFFLPNAYLGWGCSWIVFFLIPLVPSFVEALHKRSFTTFAYPVLVTAVYLLLGMIWGLWHPWWVLFISIPLYYILFEPIDKVIRNQRIKNGSANIKIQTEIDDKDDEDDQDDDDVIDVDAK